MYSEKMKNEMSTNGAHSSAEEIKATVRALLGEFITANELQNISDATPLMTGGVLDSITLVELVASLEDRYGVTIHSHEMSVDYFDSLDDIAAMVQSKQAEAS